MYKNEIAFENHENGMKVAKALLDEDYVVLLSYEEQLLIVNYEWSECGADRNDVVFMRRDEYDEEITKTCDDVIDDIRHEIAAGYIQSLNEI